MTDSAAASILRISVVLCTRNRADLFDKAMASVVAQDFPKDAYEIIVVDNGSTDHTADVAQRHAAQANVRYVLEQRVGLCIARNTGWQAARAPYVVLFDDDALAKPGWLAAAAEAFEQSPPTVGVIGGRVDPIWLAPRPGWLSDEIAGSLTVVDWGSETKVIPDLGREWLVGANMGAPKAVIEKLGGFHPWLDRVGTNLLSSGDVHLQKEAVRHGYECLYVPAMAIDHLAPPARLNQPWFTKRFYWQGISDAVMEIIDRSPSKKRRLRLAFDRLKRLLKTPGRLKALFARTEDPALFRLKCYALIDLGFVAGMLGAARR